MNLLVIGASGGCGRWLVRLAAERGHRVAALVRPSAAYEAPQGVEVIRGESLDASVVHGAVRGRDAVVSCLGLRRAGKSPWARLLSPPDLTQRVAQHTVRAMHAHGVRRIAAISAAGVGDSARRLTFVTRRLVGCANVGVAYRDLGAMERELARSGLDTLIVRPVTLTGGAPTGRAREVSRYGLLSTVRRADVARWMVDALDGESGGRAVMIGSK